MMQPCDDEELPSFADASMEETAASPPPQQPSPPTTSSSKYQVKDDGSDDGDGDDDDDDEFHDSEADGTAANYTLVKKSVFKEPKRVGGLLRRLKDASVRNKYVPTASAVAALESGSAVVAPRVRRAQLDAAPQIVIAAHVEATESADSSSSSIGALTAAVPPPSDENYGDDGSDITVAIQLAETTATAGVAAQEGDADAMHFVKVEEDLDDVAAPQVVIHSGESDSDSTGFATLNPVLSASSSSSKRYRSTIPLAISSTPPAGSSSTTASATATGGAPCLQEIPTMSSSGTAAKATSDHKLMLVVNALGASGLAKVEKFGTQSTFLEMRLCSAAEDPSSTGDELAASPALDSSSVTRTALHKKGGSDAQWNQQFSLPLRSTATQLLHLAVKTHGKAVVGDTRVSLAKLLPGGLYYDQHYTIYRRSLPGKDADTESGLVHLQLKVMDASSVAAVPPLQLPFPTSTKSSQHTTLPAVLRSGALLFKVPYHSLSQRLGAPGIQRQWVMVAPAASGGYEITWCDPTASVSDRKSTSGLELALVTEVRAGHRTPAFERQLQIASKSSVVRDPDKCFSLVAKSRTLDLVASCKEEADVWVSALREALFPTSDSSASDAVLSARVMEDYKTSALSPRHGNSESIDKAAHYGQALSSSSSRSGLASKAQLVAWRSVVFDLARRARTQEIAACLHDGCPVDLLEPGEGDTMLMIACRLGHVQLVELCLSWRAKNDPHPEFGETALQTAVNAAHSECVALLLTTAAKSDMDAEIVNHIDSRNDAPLHVAARHGDLACLQLLLHHGADICAVEEFGRTPLHCAVAHGRLECAAYLLDVGGDSVLNAGDHDGDTALHYAALAGNEAIVQLLLESAADVFSANAQNETPYDLALREKQQACAFLISPYYLTNTKEAPAASSSSSVPATRNEPASTLLLRHQQKLRQAEDDCEEEEDDDDEIEQSVSGSDTSSAYASRRPPERCHGRVLSAPKYSGEYRNGHEEEECDDYGAPLQRDPRYREPNAVPSSRGVLSPSDEVRKALLRKQTRWTPSEPSYGHHAHQYRHHYESAPTGRPAFYHSPRDAPSSSPYYTPANSFRGAFTERFDRDGDRQHAHQLYEDSYSHARHPAPSLYAVAGRSRSHSDEMYQYRHSQNAWQQWDGDQGTRSGGVSYSQDGRRSTSVDMALRPMRSADDGSVRTGWGNSSSRSDAHSVHDQLWDTFYTAEGYAYYVHRRTGISQWENPTAPPPPPPLMAQAQLAPQHRGASRDAVQETAMTPDSIIRMRLAEARSQKNSVSTASSSQVPPSTGVLGERVSTHHNTEQQSWAEELPIPPAVVASPPSPAARPSKSEADDAPSEVVSPASALPPPVSPPPASPAAAESKYQSRTGFKLSIDVSSPTRKDGTRERSPPRHL